MNLKLYKNHIFPLFFIIILLISLFAALILVKQSQEVRKKAGGGESSRVILSLYPTIETFKVGEAGKVFELKAQFIDAAASEKVDYIKTELTFNKNYIKVPSDKYIDTGGSGMSKIFRVDGPTAANDNGKIIIELGVNTPSTGPLTVNAATANTITIAKIYFAGVAETPSEQTVTIGNSEVVNNLNHEIPATVGNLAYKVYPQSGTVVTPSPTCTPRPNCLDNPLSGCDPQEPVGGWCQPVPPSPTCTPRPACLDNPLSGCDPQEPVGGWCQPVPPLTIYPSVPTPTITPTPPSGNEKYTIDIGNKQWLSINIGSGLSPQIRFKTKLAYVQNTPEIYLRLRVKDDLAFTSGISQPSGDTCQNAPAGSTDYWIPVRAEGGVYKPVPKILTPLNPGLKAATVSDDGWISLDGVAAGRYYTLYLKSQKTRSTRMIQHILLSGATKSSVQDYDWTDEKLALLPGDLPDPNKGNKQDCTVNSVDISLVNSRISKNDKPSLDIADVNYDSEINGADISKIVMTLSTKPDDDN